MKFNTVNDIREYIESFPKAGKKNGTERFKALISALNNPQKYFKSIHIAGSKGKGSVSALISFSLKNLGHKTGLYMSPHVLDFRERFTLSGNFFSDKEMIKTAEEFYELTNNFTYTFNKETSRPSVFELYTAFAFLLFKNTGCEYAVLETGLGGRLDATNIVYPICSVITPIELEHTNILGNTIKEIAIEKSKIIKPHTPVFISYQKEEAYNIFKKEALDNNSEIYFLKNEITNLKTFIKGEKQNTLLTFKDNSSYKLKLSMLGKVQAENAAISLLVLKKMNILTESNQNTIINALEEVTLPARMQKIKRYHTYYVDGAHTINSIQNAVDTIKEMYPKNAFYCVFGCILNKDYKKMCNILLQNFNMIIVSKPGTYKSSNIKDIYSYLKSKCNDTDALNPCRKLYLIEEAKDVIRFLNNHVNKNAPILVCGSFYLADTFINALNTYN